MQKIIVSFTTLLLYCTIALTQVDTNLVSERFCATMEMDSLRRQKHPEAGTLNDYENWLQQEIAYAKKKNSITTQSSTVLTIPYIVHVIHNGEAVGTGRNISAAQVYSQIDVFNKDFRRKNADTTNTPAVFKPVAADFELEFCPALVDLNGNLLAEPGIHRVDRNTMGFTAPPHTRNYTDLTMKPPTSWDPKKYLNIWVLDLSGGIAGYGQFPDSSGLSGSGFTPNASAQTDGITMWYKTFGTTGTLLGGYNKGRSATHELGHWLGLRHIWGDASCGNDHCNDTPQQSGPYTGCPSFPQITCSNGPNGAMFTNYMDQTSDACKNIFTQGQKTRARTVMQVSPRRRELPYSTVCIPPVVSEFTASSTQACAGKTITFNDQSINTPTSWSWKFQGGTPATSSQQNPVIRYNTPGVYSVTLSAVNVNGGTPKIRTSYIQVHAAPTVSATGNSSVCKGNTLQLSANGGTSYQWSPSAGLTNHLIANPVFTGTTTTNYTVQVTNSNGCTSLKTVSLTVWPLPIAVINVSGSSASTASVCEGDSLQLSASGGASYQWSPSAGLTNHLIANPVFTGTATTNYTVQVTNTNGCTSIQTLSLTLLPVITPTITISGNTLTSSQATAYQWYKNDVLIAGATARSYNVTANGIYKVVVTDANGCTTTAQYTVSGVGLETELPPENIMIYPNPSNGEFTISGIDKRQIASIYILNTVGEIIMECTADTTHISLSTKGLYLLEINFSNGTKAIRKIVVN